MPSILPVVDTDALLVDARRRTATVTVAIDDAPGRVLREEIDARRPYPPFDRVAMDGIAIAIGDAAPRPAYRLCGIQRAGEPPQLLSSSDACIEVMTGAVLPHNCDTVVRREDLQLDGAHVRIASNACIVRGQNVHRCGSDAPAGAPLLPVGTRLLPPHVAALATEGLTQVAVAARVRVALITTGDEVVPVDAPVAPHQIRASNAAALAAALRRHGADLRPPAHAPDDEAALRVHVDAALATSDVLVLTGGVSAGRFDLVPDVLQAAGVRVAVHGVRQKPGKPLLFGTTAHGTAVFGLPGNPVSALVGLYRYVLPFLDAAAGGTARRPHVALASPPPGNSPLTRFVPVRIEGGTATLLPWNGSGDVVSLLATDGFVEIAPGVDAPASVPYYAWAVG